MRQSACLVVNAITVKNCAVLLKLHAGGSGFRIFDSPNIKLTIWLFGAGHLSVGPTGGLPLLQCLSGVADAQGRYER